MAPRLVTATTSQFWRLVHCQFQLRCPLPVQSPVDRGPGNSKQLGQVANRVIAGVMHALEFLPLLGTELRLPAPQFAFRSRNRHAFTGTHPDQVRLKLSERRQNTEEQLPYWKS